MVRSQHRLPAVGGEHLAVSRPQGGGSRWRGPNRRHRGAPRGPARVQLGLVVAVVVCGAAAAVHAEQEGQASVRPAAIHASVPAEGRITGVVTDISGAPLGGVMVSAFGPSGAVLALSDMTGQFLLRALAPGGYQVQAHLPGFAVSRRELIEVTTAVPADYTVVLRRAAPEAPAGQVTASLGVDAAPDAESAGATPEADAGTPALHDHSNKAWWLRRVRRSVLKTTDTWIASGSASGPHGGGGLLDPRSRQSSVRYTPGLADLPVRGEVNLLTHGMKLLTGEAIPTNIANVSVGAPVWNGDWLAQGAMTTGDVSTWVVSGAYLDDRASAHQLGLTVAYGRQQYAGGNPAALSVASESRYAASFGATDSWQVSPAVTLEYGARYSTYGYIEDEGLVSPRLGVTVTPTAGTRVIVVGSQENVAPGAEEFMPPAQAGLWLPPERTFAAFSPGGGFQPERTRHYEIALEHDLTEHHVVGVRRFHQDVRDQFATLFGVDVPGLAPTGHYDIARAGSVSSRGWVLTLRRQLGDRVSGAVDYTVATADWSPTGADAALGAVAPGALRAGRERFHDVSGVVETEIPETATRVFVRCRVSTAFARAGGDDPVGMDTRFEVRVNQPLPFSPFGGSRWEVLLAVRSLFFEPHTSGSMFDELLLARPPKQVVGGVTVHF